MDYQQLSDLYSQFNNYILQHFSFFWSVILGVFALIGVALFFSVKIIVNMRVTKGLGESTALIRRLEQNTIKLEKKLGRLEISLEEVKSRMQIQSFDLPLFPGFRAAPGQRCYYFKRDKQTVFISICVEVETDQLAPGIHLFACLPEGFHPTKQIKAAIENDICIIVDVHGHMTYQNENVCNGKIECILEFGTSV